MAENPNRYAKLLARAMLSSAVIFAGTIGSLAASPLDGHNVYNRAIVLAQADNTTGADQAEQPALSSKTEELRKALEDIRSRVAAQRQKNEESSSDVAASTENARNRILLLNKSLNDLKQQRQRLVGELEESRAEVAELEQLIRDQASTYEQNLVQAADAYRELEGRAAEQNQLIGELNATNETALATNNNLASELDAIKLEMAALQVRRGELETDLNNRQQVIQQQQQEITAAEDDIRQLVSQLDELKTQEGLASNRADAAENDAAELRVQVADMRQEVANIRATSSELIRDLESEHERQLGASELRAADLEEDLRVLQEVASASVIEAEQMAEQLIATLEQNSELETQLELYRTEREQLLDGLEIVRIEVDEFLDRRPGNGGRRFVHK